MEFDFDAIYNEAERRYTQHRHRVGGQLVTALDGIEYWCALVVHEHLIQEIEEWRSCASYDPKMEGPQFKGWDRSQMDRCRRKYIEEGK